MGLLDADLIKNTLAMMPVRKYDSTKLLVSYR